MSPEESARRRPAPLLGSAGLGDFVDIGDFIVSSLGLGFDDLAQLLTLPVLALEASIAGFFLLPRRWRLAECGDWALTAFLVTTYALASVVGFGSTLAILGIGQAGDRRTMIAAYGVALLLVQAYQISWWELAA